MFKRKNLIYLAVVLSSACLFIMIYGIYVLDVTNTDWLMAGGDLSQHYLGWRFYRNASWQPLIGLTDHIAYPFQESVIFTDSIPLFAVIFKLFRSVLPEQFQYFGIWGLFCFILQGTLAAKILEKYLKHPLQIFFGSQLFVIAPVIIQRMYWHTSLAAHWIILLAICMIIYQHEWFHKWYQSAAAWVLIGFLCASVHIYYLPMCACLLVSFVLSEFFSKKPVLQCLVSIPAFSISSLATIWILGGFASGMSDGAPGLGFYSFNLNGFYNPQDWSAIFPNLEKYADGQYEGFAYLGIGVIVLFVLTVLLLILAVFINIIQYKTKKGADIHANTSTNKNTCMNELKHAIATKKHLFCIVAGIFLTVLFAASPEISFYSKLIFHPALPKKIIDLWAIFRSTGRMIWPVVYWIMIAAVCTVPSYVKKKKYAKPVLIIWTILLMTALGLQGYDLHKKIGERHAEFAKKTIYESPLQSNFWKDVMQFRDKKHLLFADKDNLSQGELYAFSDYAADHGMTINNFYFARALTEPLQEVADDFMEHCDTQTIYVFTWKSRMRTADYNLHYYQVDDWLVGLKEPIKGYEEIQVEEMMNWHAEFDGTFVNEGEDDKGVRTLHSGGVSYGPYMELPEGHYRVTVQGEHLSNAYCLAYHKGSELYRFEPVSEKKTDQAVIYEIMIDQEVKDIEFVVRNQSEEDVILYGIYVQYLPY